MQSDYHPRIHELKTWRTYYDQVRDGVKRFELRKNDRNYRVGDLLILREYIADTQQYTGYALCAVVTCVIDDATFLQPGYVALGIRVLKEEP